MLHIPPLGTPCPGGGGEQPQGERTFVIVLCGLPGAGKSTVAAHLARQLGDAEVIATDVMGGHRPYERLRRRLAGLAGRRRYVVLDGTFYSRRHRDAVRAMGYPILLTYLTCPLEVCLLRNTMRPRGIPEGGVRGIARRFEAPTAEEGPLRVPTHRIGPQAAARRIYRAVLRRALGHGRLLHAHPETHG